MNNFQLKILACITMVIDHIGVILFPKITFLRIIGRLSFPIFAFLLAEGYIYSKNLKKFFLRLLIFAIIPQIIYSFYFKTEVLNIFFTLFSGLLFILVDDKVSNKYTKYPLMIIILIISHFAHMDYGFYGVLTIYTFYKFRKKEKAIFIGQSLLTLTYLSTLNVQIFSLVSLFFIKQHNGKEGYKTTFTKYVFYFFYPVHLGILFWLSIH